MARAAALVLLALAFTSLCAVRVRADDDAAAEGASEPEAPNDVLVLSPDNFKDVIIAHELVMVKFFAPWCGHCKAMKDDYIAAAAELKGTAVLCDLDATEHEALARANQIEGFPTLKIYANGKFLKDYKGARDTKSIVKYMQHVLDPSFVELKSADEVKSFLEDVTKARIIAVKPADIDMWKTVTTQVYDAVSASTKMALVSSADIVSSFIPTAAEGRVVVIPADEAPDSEDVKTTEITSDEALNEFLLASAMPVFGELTQANARVYVDKQMALVVLFMLNNEDMTWSVAQQFKSVAKKVVKKHSDLRFVYIISTELKGFKQHMFGQTDPKIPVGLYKFAGDQKYTWDQAAEFSPEALEEWIDKVQSGALQPPRKSATRPDKDEGPVKIVVGNTWEEIVEDKNKDVLVMQMAPWCGHCKKLKPTWEKLAEELKNEENIVIAMMDATENEAPPAVRAKGFPTIHFYPAGDVQKPLPYEGDRSEDDLKAFIKKHAKAQHSLSSGRDEL